MRNAFRTSNVIRFPKSRKNGHIPPSPGRKIYGADRIGLCGFHDRGFVIAKPAEAHSAWLQERSQQLHTRMDGRGTNLTDGLRKAIELLQRTPKGVLRRIWLLTDGCPNQERDALMSVVAQARRAYININTIGFGDTHGDTYDEALLRQISAATHNGKFVPVSTLRQLTDTLVLGSNGKSGQNRHRHRSETSVLAIDLSPSMNLPMGGKSRIQVVEEAALHLLHYKQQCFS